MSGRQEREVDLALVFAVDCSGSVSNERMTMYIEGHAQAVTSPGFVAGLTNLPTGRAALAFVFWSNHDRQTYTVPWRVVDGLETAADWAQALRTATRPGAGFTSISGAIDFCHDHLLRVAPPAARRVIDIVADGQNNDGRPVRAARDAAVAAGITINGLPVLENDPTLDDYFAREVVGGPACFVLPVKNGQGCWKGSGASCWRRSPDPGPTAALGTLRGGTTWETPMHYLALAVDYDGTIAHHGVVDEATQTALRRLRAGARRLILVTGRELEDLRRVGPPLDLFDLVVAENGALLFDPATGEATALVEAPPERFISRLREMEVSPLSVGAGIVATWEPNETKVLAAIRELGLDLQITFNKGAVMVLPAGVTKASGLRAALEKLELSPLNCAAIGDAENDLPFVEACGLAVAVANALPSVKDRVALVTEGDHGAGVAELVDRILATDLMELDARPSAPRVALVASGEGEEELYAPQRESLLITGQSGGGKSTLVLGLLERVAARGFQWCVLDPEGDYEGTEGAVQEGTAESAPEAAQVLDLLRKTRGGVVASLLALKLADRPAFLARLLPEILALRARVGRPHVVVVDEAHHMLSRDWDPGGAQVPAELEGFVFVTTTPDQVSPRVLACVNRLLVVGREAGRSVAAFCRARGLAEPGSVAAMPELEPGEVLVFDPVGGDVRRMKAIPGTGERRRHRLKYAEGKLGEDTSFYFRGAEEKLNLRAHNLILFLDMGDGVDEETWEFHRRRGDYSAWMRDKVKDADLADEVAAVEQGDKAVEAARALVRAAVERRYTAPG